MVRANGIGAPSDSSPGIQWKVGRWSLVNFASGFVFSRPGPMALPCAMPA